MWRKITKKIYKFAHKLCKKWKIQKKKRQTR